MGSNFLTAVTENVVFVLIFLGTIMGMFFIAFLAEKWIQKRNHIQEKIFTTRKNAIIGLFAAISTILIILEFPIPFIAPGFYEMDFSELPALIAAFAFGPVAGVMVEFIKILLKVALKGTSTAFVGDLANFVIGCTFILPASIIYEFKKSKKNAIISCVVGTLSMTVFGTFFNAVYLIPTFAKMFFMHGETTYEEAMAQIIGYGTALHAGINDVTSFVIMAVAPFNLLKGFSVSLLTILIYKGISPILKNGHMKQTK